MKKFGFTLAEVLITLGIVGVVAALTAPALVQNAGSAQIGPKLAKAVNTFEVANENLLSDTGAATVVGAGATGGDASSTSVNYINNLSNYMKVNYSSEASLSSSEKYSRFIKDYNGNSIVDYTTKPINEIRPGSSIVKTEERSAKSIRIMQAATHIGLSKEGMIFGIDLNENSRPGGTVSYSAWESPEEGLTGSAPHKQQIGNLIIDVNGYAKPNRLGKDLFAFALMADGSLVPVGYSGAWNVASTACNSTKVVDGYTCAGSVFENNLKVIYQ